MKKLAIVLFNLGGPDTLQDVEPFLFNLFNDPAILRMNAFLRYCLARLIVFFRKNKAKKIYARMGGGSPLRANTEAQANALKQVLTERGHSCEVFVCMRYWHPRIEATLKQVAAYQPDHIVLLPLYPQYSTTTSGSSLNEWQAAISTEADLCATPSTTIGCFPVNDALVSTFANHCQPHFAEAAAHGKPVVLYSAHGLPQSIVDEGDPYQLQVELTAAQLTKRLTEQGYDFEAHLCYQSRVGPKKWLGPATETVIEDFAKKGRALIVVPIAFVSDHSETLVELDMDYKELALQQGASYYGRVASLADHPLFISGLATEIENKLNGIIAPVYCPTPMTCACRINAA